jgi:uncharacterized damage-inducible protein DinB
MEPKDELQFPPIPEALLRELNRRFPEHCADLEWSEKQVWFMSGQRAIVRFLNHIYQIQSENPLS